MTGTAAHGTKKGWGSLTGSCSLSDPCPAQGTGVPRWSVSSQKWHPAPHTYPTLWHNGQSSSEISENSIPGPSSHLGADGFSGLSSCVGWTSPAQLPTVRSALQSSTAFKQEPRCPPVNHLAHPPHPQHDGLRTAHISTFSTPFTAPASSTCPALTHSHAAHVPKAALRDHGEHKPPRGVCSRSPAGSARTGGLTALCSQVDCPPGDLDSGSSGS